MEQTSFAIIYESFLSKITDDMYMELTEIETFRMLEELLMSAIPHFEFPRISLDFEPSEIDDGGTYCGVESNFEIVDITYFYNGHFNSHLTLEEINIIATYMIVEWLGQQLANIENVRMKYSGTDFKFTSQANHMTKVMALKKEYERLGFHLQRLYKRRRVDKYGIPKSTMNLLMSPYIEED